MKIYSTLSRKKEEFVPIKKGMSDVCLRCNPYMDAHLGHAMSYIAFDVIRVILNSRVTRSDMFKT
jgi:cysteinyl-tRNA synthetase